VLGQPRQRDIRGGAGGDLEAALGEIELEQVAHRAIVVDHQDSLGHVGPC